MIKIDKKEVECRGQAADLVAEASVAVYSVAELLSDKFKFSFAETFNMVLAVCYNSGIEMYISEHVRNLE